jgi:hypothetical protein
MADRSDRRGVAVSTAVVIACLQALKHVEADA